MNATPQANLTNCEEVFFRSHGLLCAADLYFPHENSENLPCVIMGHGGSGTKRLGLQYYAAEFLARGLAVMTFDYRNFGRSEGEPRQLIDVQTQREDYHSAIAFARNHPHIDANRISIWGTSLSGGHVLDVAANDSALAAVVSQVPMIDGLHRGRNLRQRLNMDVMLRSLQFIAAAVYDIALARLHKPPFLVPVVAESGKVAVFSEPEAKRAFDALGGEAVGWRNELAPRFFFALPRYKPGTAERISMPVLMCIADQDLQASAVFAAKIASLIQNVKAHHYPVGHFDVYSGQWFEQISSAEADFLQLHLRR